MPVNYRGCINHVLCFSIPAWRRWEVCNFNIRISPYVFVYQVIHALWRVALCCHYYLSHIKLFTIKIIKQFNTTFNYDITKIIEGRPDEAFISTSYVERQNLTMRMHMRRFTRLTNAFSKKIENHCHAIALHFVYYNFAKVHKTLRVTPAMEAKLATKPMTIEDIVNLIDKYEGSK